MDKVPKKIFTQSPANPEASANEEDDCLILISSLILFFGGRLQMCP